MAMTGLGLQLQHSPKVSVLDGKLFVNRPPTSPTTFKALSLLALGRTDTRTMARVARLYPDVEPVIDIKAAIRERQEQYSKEIKEWETTRDAWQYVDGEKYTEPAKRGVLTTSGRHSVKLSKTINPLPASMSHGMKAYRALEQIMESWTPGDKLARMRLIVKNDPQRYFNGVTLISEHVIADTISIARGTDGDSRPISTPFNQPLQLESTRRGTEAAKEFNRRPHAFQTVFKEGETPVTISIRNGVTAHSGFRFSMLQVIGDRINSETEADFDPNNSISAEAILEDVAKDRAHRLSRNPHENPLSHKTFQEYTAPLAAGRFPKGEKYTTFLPTFTNPKELTALDFEPHYRSGRREDGRIRLIESRVKDLWVDRVKLAKGEPATTPGLYRIEKELKEMEDAYNGFRCNPTEGVAVVAYPGEVVNQELHQKPGTKGLTEQEQIYNFLAMLARWSEDFPERRPIEIHISRVTRLNQNGADYEMYVAMVRYKTEPNSMDVRKDILTGDVLPEKKLRRVPKDIRAYMDHYGSGSAITQKFQKFRTQWADMRKTYQDAIKYMEDPKFGKLPKEEVWNRIDAEKSPQLDPNKKYDKEALAALRVNHARSKRERILQDKMYRDVDLAEARQFIKEVPDFAKYDDLKKRERVLVEKESSSTLNDIEKADLKNLRRLEAEIRKLEDEKILSQMEPLLPFLADQKYLDETAPLSFIDDDDENLPYVVPGYAHTTLHAIADLGLPSYRGAETTEGDGVFEIEHMTPQFFYDKNDGLGTKIKLDGSWGENFAGVCLSFANRCIYRPQDTIHRTSFNVSPRAEVLGDRTAEPFLRVIIKGLYTDEEVASGKVKAPDFYYDPAAPVPFDNTNLLKERYERGRGFREGPRYPFGSEKTKRYRNDDGLINANRLPYEAAEGRELRNDETGQVLVSTHRQQDMWMKEDGQAAFHGITREDGFGMAIIDHPSGTDPEDSPRSHNLREVLGDVNWLQMYSGKYQGLPKRRVINLEHHYMYGSHYGHLRDPISGQIIHTNDSEPSFREFTALGYVEEPSTVTKSSQDFDSNATTTSVSVTSKNREQERRTRYNSTLAFGLRRVKPEEIFSPETLKAMRN